VSLAVALRARSVLYTSSTGVYGRTAGEQVDELTALHPDDARQQALVDAERVLWDDAAPHAIGAIVLRVAGLYGPGRDPGRRFSDPATVADGGDSWSNFSWRDDVADAVLHLLAYESCAHGAHCFNCTDGHPVQAKTIARALGVDVDASREHAADVASEAETTSAGTALNARSRKSNQRISIARLLATGWTPSVPTVFDGLERLGHPVTRPATSRAKISS
jgi:nucleoside-diphosphate-sugar epimerase